MINLLNSRNIKFRKLVVVIKNFSNCTHIRTFIKDHNSVTFICFLNDDGFVFKDNCLRALNSEGVIANLNFNVLINYTLIKKGV